MAGKGNRKNRGKHVQTNITFLAKQLAKKFKHAGDFGVKGSFGAENAEKYRNALEKHVFSSEVTAIAGTYRGIAVTHYVNRKTAINVIVDSTGRFYSGWKLSAAQLEHVLSTGKLGGG